MLHLNIYGEVYDDSEPCFLTTMEGEFVYNSISREWVNWASLDAKAVEIGHTWQPREVGIPSIKWQLRNSHVSGQSWAPGFDDTEGLLSEQVVNGEVWTDAAGETPPTGWTVLGAQTFTLNAGWLTVETTTGVGGFGQGLPGLEPGKTYVLEVGVGDLTTGNNTLEVGGQIWLIGYGPDTRAFSFVADGAVTGIEIRIPKGSVLDLNYLRVYLESELTGSVAPLVVVDEEDEPPAPDIDGPFTVAGTKFWIDTTTGMIGFNVDSDPPADIWLDPVQVCAATDVEDAAKIEISARLAALGCQKLPCVTVAGKLTAAYLNSKENDDG